MIEEINKFEAVLEKYSFVEPIPQAIQDIAVSSKKSNLTTVLKRVNNYNFIFGMILWVYYIARKFLISPTLGQSAFILGAGTIALTGVISSGSYVSYKIIKDFKKETIEPRIEESKKQKSKVILPGIDSNRDIRIKNPIHKEKDDLNNQSHINEPNNLRVRLGIKNITPRGVSKNRSSEISRQLYKKLKSIKGTNKVIYINSSERKKSINRQLTCKISKLGTGYILNFRVTNVESGEIIFNETAKISNINDTDSILDNISNKILGNKKIWEIKKP
ncbi:hypothetical protein ACFL20_08900 [Spirochaetota bacterium]